MKIHNFKIVLVALAASYTLTAAAGDKEVGNGGDALRLLFKDAQVNARAEFAEILDCSFPNWVDLETKNWVLDHKEELVNDIVLSNHIWTDEDPKHECSWTMTKPMADVHFSFTACKQENITPNKAFELIIHESTHHLGVTDEQMADRVALAISQSFRAEACEGYSQGGLKTVGGDYRPSYSASGRLMANERGDIFDLNIGKKIFSFPNLKPGELPRFQSESGLNSFSPNEEKFLFISDVERDMELGILNLITHKISYIKSSTESFWPYGIKGAWSKDSKYFAFNNGKGNIILVDSDNLSFKSKKFIPEGQDASLRFNPSSNDLVIAGNCGIDSTPEHRCQVTIWDYQHDKIIQQFTALIDKKSKEINSSLSPSGKILFVRESLDESKKYVHTYWETKTGNILKSEVKDWRSSTSVDGDKAWASDNWFLRLDQPQRNPDGSNEVHFYLDNPYNSERLDIYPPFTSKIPQTEGYITFAANGKSKTTAYLRGSRETAIFVDLIDISSGNLLKSWPVKIFGYDNFKIKILDNLDVLLFDQNIVHHLKQ